MNQNLNLGRGAVLAREVQAQVHKVYVRPNGPAGGIEFFNNAGGEGVSDKRTFAMSVGLHENSASHPGLELAYLDGSDVKHPVLSLGYVGNDYTSEKNPSEHGRPAVVIGSAVNDDKVDLVVQGGENTYMVFDALAQQLRLGSAGSGKTSGELLKLESGSGYSSSNAAISVAKGGLTLSEGSALLSSGNLTLASGDLAVLGSTQLKSGTGAADYSISGSAEAVEVKAGSVSIHDDSQAKLLIEDGSIQMHALTVSGPASVAVEVGQAGNASRAGMTVARDGTGELSSVSVSSKNTDGMGVAHVAEVKCDDHGVKIHAEKKKVEIVGPLELKAAADQIQSASLAYSTVSCVAESTFDSNATADTRAAVSTGSVSLNAKASGVANYTSRVRVRPTEVLITGHNPDTGAQQMAVTMNTGDNSIAIDADEMTFTVDNLQFDENTDVTFLTAPNFEAGINITDLELDGDLTVGGVVEVMTQLKVSDGSGGESVFDVDAAGKTVTINGTLEVLGNAPISLSGGSGNVSSVALETEHVRVDGPDVEIVAEHDVLIEGALVDVSSNEIVIGNDTRNITWSLNYSGYENSIIVNNDSDFTIGADSTAGKEGGLHVRTTTHFEKDVVMDGRLVVHGDLDIKGQVNSIATTETQLHVEDKTIVLNKASDAEQVVSAEGSGMLIRKGAEASGDMKSLLYQEVKETNAAGGDDSAVAGVFQVSNSVHIAQGASEAGFMQEPAMYFGGASGELPLWRMALVGEKLVFQKRVAGTASSAPHYVTKFTIDDQV